MTSRQSKPEEAAWFKSSYSGGTGNSCVEIAHLAPWVGIRDSKNAASATLLIPTTSWTAFIRLVCSEAATG
ncbi:DUF397 domain-containing protein [Streptomyces sp. NPDC059568]|uniref:DUF397 domain-containing protein n=1 Tax=Streptomyces sp. NPDC059568 TaxID=3346868 RepID=UPI003686535D